MNDEEDEDEVGINLEMQGNDGSTSAQQLMKNLITFLLSLNDVRNQCEEKSDDSWQSMPRKQSPCHALRGEQDLIVKS